MTTPREDDATHTPPHGDALADRAAGDRSSATRHGVQLDPRGEPADAASFDEGVPSTPRSAPRRDETP